MVGTAIFLSTLLAIAHADLLIDGGDSGWQTESWYSQVDGVMGGKSSGDLTFLESDTVMSFSGIISLDGGGFSSVIKSFSSAIDLSSYAGFVVELETTSAHDPNDIHAPLGLHLQFHDSNTRYIGYASAFAVPLSNSVGEAVSVYLPQTSFDRGSWIGRPCNDCQINFSSIVEMDIYVLFQDGPFEVKVNKITAVDDYQTFASPVISLSSTDEIKTLIDKTIQSGGGLYDKGYQELCIALYLSVLNTILASNDSSSSDATSSIVSKRMKNIICQGLQRAETQIDSKVNIAWTLRYTLDAMLEEMGFNVPSNVQAWRPDPTLNVNEYEYECRALTSAFTPLVTELSEAMDDTDNSFADRTNDFSTGEIPTSSARSFGSIPYVLIVATMLLAACCDGFSSSYPTRTSHRRCLHTESLTHLPLSQSNEQDTPQMQMKVTSVAPPPPPELKRVPLPVMLAGGLFLFATSVPSSQRSRADKLLKLAQEALQSDPTVTMELGPGVEAGNVYASSNGVFGNVDQLILQFQINGGNAWAQGITYGIEDDSGLRLISLEVANMDAVLSNQSFKVPLTN